MSTTEAPAGLAEFLADQIDAHLESHDNDVYASELAHRLAPALAAAGWLHSPRAPRLAPEPLDGRTPKYRIEKWDGTPVDPNAKYLVLRFDNKPRTSAEWHAVQAYILALDMDGRHELADHLRSFFGVNDEPLMRLEATE